MKIFCIRPICSLFGLFILLISSAMHAEVINVDSEQLKQLVAEGVTVIDVRRAEEWAETGVVPGSHQLTFFDQSGNYDATAWLNNFQKVVEPDQSVILICHTGVRSSMIADWLSNGIGIDKVYNVTAGIAEWRDQGYPTSKEQVQ